MTIYGRSEELVSRCVECDLAEPESLASLGGSAPGLVDGILSQLADNLCHLGGCIPDPNPVAVVGVTIPMPAFVFGAKSEARVSVACNLVRFYNTVRCDLTAVNMHWTHVAKNFKCGRL